MAYQQKTKDDINQAYQDIFGRDASFGTLGGADYWADKMDNQGLTLDDLKGHLKASAEGKSVTTAADGTKSSWIGGVNPNKSIADSWTDGADDWSDHFNTGGDLAGDLTGTIWEGMAGAGTGTNPTTKNVASLLNATYNTNNPNSTLPNPYYQNDPITSNTIIPGGGGATFGGGSNPIDTSGFLKTGDLDTWWAGIDKPWENQQQGGMDDFMKFMMLMSVMKPGGGGGYGGGSQYGYGGLNPGGVQSAYNPWDNLSTGWDFMKNAFGSGVKGGSTLDVAAQT